MTQSRLIGSCVNGAHDVERVHKRSGIGHLSLRVNVGKRAVIVDV